MPPNRISSNKNRNLRFRVIRKRQTKHNSVALFFVKIGEHRCCCCCCCCCCSKRPFRPSAHPPYFLPACPPGPGPAAPTGIYINSRLPWAAVTRSQGYRLYGSIWVGITAQLLQRKQCGCLVKDQAARRVLNKDKD